MFGPLGFPEVVFILVLALLIFGPKRLPEVGRTIGKGVAQFRRATTDLKRTIETEIAVEEEPPGRSATRPAVLPPPRPIPVPADAGPEAGGAAVANEASAAGDGGARSPEPPPGDAT